VVQFTDNQCPPAERSCALAGLRVLDLGRLFAAPWAGQLLGDLGADVVKVERRLTGDEMRLYGPPFMKAVTGEELPESAYSLAANRNKRSIALDISQAAAQDVVRRLAARADVLIENFKVGDLARYGLDFQALRIVNPRLIYCSITGFGQAGPRSKIAATDAIFQAMSGMMSITGEPDSEPQRNGIVIIDLLTGVYAATAILAALHSRHETGTGQYIDLALLDVGMAAMSHRATEYFMTGVSPTRVGSASVGNVPARNFTCADGVLCVQAGGDANFARLCNALQRPDLLADPTLSTRRARVKNAARLYEILEPIFATRTVEEWFDLLSHHSVYCGPVYDVAQSYAEPQAIFRGIRRSLSHPRAGMVDSIANPIRFPGLANTQSSPPPGIGEHTDDVLRDDLGMTDSDIAALRRCGAI
jgi:crotonobetainyl-CoA:carnitine CoA-transferase CaiB-like acyl-CoA transferase